MAELLSNEDVFGTAAPAVGVAKKAVIGSELSHADVFGDVPPPQEGLGILAADIGKRALSLGAATGDLLLGVPGSIAGHLMNVGTRIYAAATGESGKTGGQAGELAENLGTLTIPGTKIKVPLEGLKTPLQTLLKVATGAEPWNQEIVSSAMEKAATGIEKLSGGKITAEDAKLGVGSFMDVAGGAGLHAGSKVLAAKLVERPAVKVEAAPPEEPPVRPGPEAVEITTKKQVKEIFAAAKNAGADADARGVQQVKDLFEAAMRPKEAPVEAAPETAPEMPSVPKTRIAEPTILGEEPSTSVAPTLVDSVGRPVSAALSSGMHKLELGQGFNLTAAEKVALRGAALESEKLQNGPSRFQRGSSNWEHLAKTFVAVGAGTALGIWGYKKYKEWETQQATERLDNEIERDRMKNFYHDEVNPSKPTRPDLGRMWASVKDSGMPALLAAGAVIGADRSGVWTKGAVEKLAAPLKDKLVKEVQYPESMSLDEMNKAHAAQPEAVWADRAITKHLNKHFGAETDPLRDVKIPMLGDEVTWGEVADLANARMTQTQSGLYISAEELAKKAGVSEATAYDYLEGSRPSSAENAARLDRALHELDPEEYAPRNQRGSIDPKLLASLAVIGGGAAAAAYFNPEHPVKAAAYGAGIAALLLRAKPKAWAEAIKRARLEGPIVRIDELTRETAYQKKVSDRATYQMQDSIERAVPSVERRQAIYDYLENETPMKLTPTEMEVAKGVREFYNDLGQLAKDGGVIRELIDDYATRVYGHAKGFFEGHKVGGGTSVSSPFGKPRGYETRAEAEAAGYTPVTTDISQVVKLYADSVNAALRNKQFVRTLKDQVLPDGAKLLAKEGKAPEGYQFIDHPQLRGLRVHPDIAADMRFIFDAKDPGALIRGLDAINTTQKRLGVSLSLFHAMALEHAMIGATSILKSPARGARIFAQSFAPAIFGENLAIKMIREGGAGDMVDAAAKAGLEFGFERAVPLIAEEQSGFYQAMNAGTKFLDDIVPGAGKLTLGTVAKVNHAFDRAMWGRFHAAMKLETWMDKASELSRNNAREVEAGRGQLKSQEEIHRAAASFTNDIFGGLNWQAMMQEFSSRWGREIASAAFSPSGRLGMRMVLFAPDWTISTTRAFIKAFGQQGVAAGAGAVLGSQVMPEHDWIGAGIGGILGFAGGKAAGLDVTKGGGVRGLLRPTELADLHRQYIMRSAFIYSGIVDTINYQMSGHHIWDNKDPTRLDRGDGTTMQVSKHFMEPMHWLTTPRQQAMNKLSFVVKEPLAQLQDVEYLSAHGAPRLGRMDKDEPITLGNRAEHALKQFTPISAQGLDMARPSKAGWSMVGMPVYGKDFEERAAEKEARKQRAVQRRIDKRAKEER